MEGRPYLSVTSLVDADGVEAVNFFGFLLLRFPRCMLYLSCLANITKNYTPMRFMAIIKVATGTSVGLVT